MRADTMSITADDSTVLASQGLVRPTLRTARIAPRTNQARVTPDARGADTRTPIRASTALLTADNGSDVASQTLTIGPPPVSARVA